MAKERTMSLPGNQMETTLVILGIFMLPTTVQKKAVIIYLIMFGSTQMNFFPRMAFQRLESMHFGLMYLKPIIILQISWR